MSVAGAAICDHPLTPSLERSSLYPVSFVTSDQARLIELVPAAVATRLAGAAGTLCASNFCCHSVYSAASVALVRTPGQWVLLGRVLRSGDHQSLRPLPCIQPE